MENINQQQQDFQQKQTHEQNLQTKVSVCKHCGASLDDDVAFCPECGEKIGGEERICPICKTSTTSEFCPNCGTRVIPVVCPNCGKESYSDFCDECGTILNETVQQVFEQPEQEIKQLSQEEAEQIKNDIRNSITPEIKEFIRKVEECRILLEERDYFKKREKRIIKVFGQSPFEFSEQDPEEQKIILKAYEGLKKVLEKEKKQKEEEEKQKEEKLYENESKRKEMQEKYENILNAIEQDVHNSKELEKERKRKQRIFEDRILGEFLYIGDEYEMWLKFDSKISASSYDLCHVCGNTICCKYDVKYDFQNISLVNPRVIGERDGCGFLPAVSGTNFIGQLNADGTIINGNWKSASRHYMKVSN